MASSYAPQPPAAPHSFGRLERWGAPTDLALRASHGVAALRVFEMPDRLLVVNPVQSLEGPRGMLAFEVTPDNQRAEIAK